MTYLLLGILFLRPFIASRAFVQLHAGISLLLLCMMTAWIISRRAWRAYDAVFFAAAALTVISAISALFSAHRALCLETIGWYATGALLYLVGRSLQAREREDALRLMAATGVCVAIFAIHQYYTGFARTLEYVQTHGGADAFTMDYLRQRRAFFPFVTPNTLAVYLVMTACLSRGVVRGTWYLAPITVALVLTKSVGGLITAFAAAMLYCALRSKSAARIIAIAILLMAAGCGIMLMRHRDSALHQHPAFSVLMRTAYWRQSAEIIAQHPWRGVGAGNFDLPRSRYAHNALLQTGAELGIPGILALSLCIGALGYALLRHCRRRTWTRQDASLAACIFAFAVHNLFDFSWFLPEINFLWWFTAGMLTAGIAAHTARPSTGT